MKYSEFLIDLGSFFFGFEVLFLTFFSIRIAEVVCFGIGLNLMLVIFNVDVGYNVEYYVIYIDVTCLKTFI